MTDLLMFIIPLLGIILMRLMPDQKSGVIAALGVSLISLVETAVRFCMIDPLSADTVIFDQYWLSDLGISFKIGLDGLSMLMVLLTNVLVPLIIYSSIERKINDYKNYFGLIFLMQFALLGVFTSLDGFLFYVFWELALIPVWFICLLWGGNDRNRITLKFFIYTLSGSLLMLIGFIYMYLQTPGNHSFDIESFYNLNLSQQEQSWLFWAFFAAFAVKIPLFPLHTWQPDTYTSAPTQGTMLLSAIMLKMGLYGIIRWMVPIMPGGIDEWGWLALMLSITGIVYGSAMAIAQKDFKRLIAYSSIAHVGLIAAGIFSMNITGAQGAVYQMLSHGVNVIGLFFIADILLNRFGHMLMDELGGIAHRSKPFSILFMIILLGSVALPLTNGFIGEFMLLTGVYLKSAWGAAFAGLTIILGAVYMFRAYQKIMLGNESSKLDITTHEKLLLGIVASLVIVMGIYPQPLLEVAEPAIRTIFLKAGVS